MATLKVGDKAPAITAINQHGQTVSLSEFKGKKVILYFYPKDNTPGCTTEACNYRDNYQSLLADGVEVIGVSVNSEHTHRNFANKYNIPFTLLVDNEQRIVNDYSVWA